MHKLAITASPALNIRSVLIEVGLALPAFRIVDYALGFQAVMRHEKT